MQSDPITPDASAVVLAGGKSSRMGRPKALLLFDGEPLIVHITRALRQFFAEVIVVAAPRQELPPLATAIVRDEVPFQGPVGGIYYGLTAASREISFVTSCDVPFLNRALISRLVAETSRCDVAVPVWEGRFQPLHAVYRKTVLRFLKAQLDRGELRPVFLYEKVRTRKLEEEEIRRLDPRGLSFLNMNTPDDYAGALKQWQELKASGQEPGNHDSRCTVELFGSARLLAKTRAITLPIPQRTTLSEVFAALAEKLPVLAGRVIGSEEGTLLRGFACNLNGLEFVRNPQVTVVPGDRILIFSADAGG
ncbi:MAG: NTP transferase domain-containing protein [Deltaproteobacteria bacterium]|nr:NTP transferase domain-containing protein [Deltaproteobacteria bacterium]